MRHDSAAYREVYRREHMPALYRGELHLGFTLVFGITGMVLCVMQLEAVRPLEWLAVPLTFLYANLAEYLGHRFVMHRRVPGLGLIFERHARQHHRFFTDTHMELDSARDLRAVLFPPVLMVFFFGVFGTPLFLAVAWLVSANAGWLTAATALGYFLLYEILHTLYHLPDGMVGRIPGLATLRRHHLVHHDLRVMTHGCFNITFPIFDAVFGTGRERSRRPVG